jgi:5-methyltetrahydrofolate corrinoid/iron sulfur protein methyltransferase
VLIIGENIHIIAPEVKEAIAARDSVTVQRLAKEQVDGGAQMLDLNIGPRKKDGPEVVSWLIPTLQEVVDVPLSIDTTNLEAIRAGLSLVKRPGMVNSTSAEPERLEAVPPLAAEYGAKLVALMMSKTGIPVTAEERVALAIDQLIPRALEVGIPLENLYLDPLAMTVSGCQEYCPAAVEAIRYVKQGLISSGHGWMDAEPEIDHIRPDYYVVNEDGDKPEKRDYCEKHGIEYVVLKRLPKEGLPRRESTKLRGF